MSSSVDYKVENHPELVRRHSAIINVAQDEYQARLRILREMEALEKLQDENRELRSRLEKIEKILGI